MFPRPLHTIALPKRRRSSNIECFGNAQAAVLEVSVPNIIKTCQAAAWIRHVKIDLNIKIRCIISICWASNLFKSRLCIQEICMAQWICFWNMVSVPLQVKIYMLNEPVVGAQQLATRLALWQLRAICKAKSCSSLCNLTLQMYSVMTQSINWRR